VTKSETAGRCAQCGNPFDRPSTRGRSPIYCSHSCRQRVYEKRHAYDRQLLVEVLVCHQHRDIGPCCCGWHVLGESHAEHVADIYEASLLARTEGVDA